MPARINVPIEAIAARYEAGESSHALACAYGVCQATVWRRHNAIENLRCMPLGQHTTLHCKGAQREAVRGGAR